MIGESGVMADLRDKWNAEDEGRQSIIEGRASFEGVEFFDAPESEETGKNSVRIGRSEKMAKLRLERSVDEKMGIEGIKGEEVEVEVEQFEGDLKKMIRRRSSLADMMRVASYR